MPMVAPSARASPALHPSQQGCGCAGGGGGESQNGHTRAYDEADWGALAQPNDKDDTGPADPQVKSICHTRLRFCRARATVATSRHRFATISLPPTALCSLVAPTTHARRRWERAAGSRDAGHVTLTRLVGREAISEACAVESGLAQGKEGQKGGGGRAKEREQARARESQSAQERDGGVGGEGESERQRETARERAHARTKESKREKRRARERRANAPA